MTDSIRSNLSLVFQGAMVVLLILVLVRIGDQPSPEPAYAMCDTSQSGSAFLTTEPCEELILDALTSTAAQPTCDGPGALATQEPCFQLMVDMLADIAANQSQVSNDEILGRLADICDELGFIESKVDDIRIGFSPPGSSSC